MMQPNGAIFIATLIGILMASCSSPSYREVISRQQDLARPRSAAYGADSFYSEAGQPDRPKDPNADFFFKKCSLSGRHPYPSSKDWDCNEPQ